MQVHNNLARTLANASRFDDAQREPDRAISMAEALRAAAPDYLDVQADLALRLNNRASLCQATG